LRSLGAISVSFCFLHFGFNTDYCQPIDSWLSLLGGGVITFASSFRVPVSFSSQLSTFLLRSTSYTHTKKDFNRRRNLISWEFSYILRGQFYSCLVLTGAVNNSHGNPHKSFPLLLSESLYWGPFSYGVSKLQLGNAQTRSICLLIWRYIEAKKAAHPLIPTHFITQSPRGFLVPTIIGVVGSMFYYGLSIVWPLRK